ncbi:hypothetical protein [Ornithinicoccus hortensis]|uniref:DUF819 family protein n=1 Tax=Ornithinicoccus hortensis TaxID=82346 RepID=A0A542YUF0_9MICO|nr:hypothetical protein [Ornithinicoccus hortensis]TQL51711.1 hypothetical protein FB467_2865 [Ornithinicoccus hortensis]
MDFLPAVGIASLMFLLLAIGDLISTRTHARVPAILVAIVLYLVLVWTGVVDGEVVSGSVVNPFGVMVISVALVHLGTIIPISVLIAQWRAVLIAICGLIVAVAPVSHESPHRLLLPQRYLTPSLLLAMIAVLGTLAFFLGEWTGLNYGIWSLLIGIACQYFGVLPAKALDEANSFGIVTAGIMVVVLASMGGVTVSQLLDSIGPVLMILFLGTVGLLVGGMLAARLIGWDPKKAMPVSLTALIGFPADYIICEEIAHSLGEDTQQRDAIMDEILAPMLVGGFTSVSLASVMIASTLVGTL